MSASRWLAVVLAAVLLVCAGVWVAGRVERGGRASSLPAYTAPQDAAVTVFEAREAPARTLRIEAATDVSFMRPMIEDFQNRNPRIRILYIDRLSTALFQSASRLCASAARTADLYVTISTDHLVRLANDGCALKGPGNLARDLPGWRNWRDEVVAFSLEPGVIVYNRRAVGAGQVPDDHAELVALLRRQEQAWRGRIGAYDIEQSGSGYIFAERDSRESPLYGQLLESLGRSGVRLYCCSNTMVEAVASGEIVLAYNVQMSYAVAGLRQGHDIGVVLPDDYQAVLTRSTMIPKGAAEPELARLFVSYLVSPPGQEIARRQGATPQLAAQLERLTDGRMPSQAAVSPVLLRLQDQGRRERMIREWRQAIQATSSVRDRRDIPVGVSAS